MRTLVPFPATLTARGGALGAAVEETWSVTSRLSPGTHTVPCIPTLTCFRGAQSSHSAVRTMEVMKIGSDLDLVVLAPAQLGEQGPPLPWCPHRPCLLPAPAALPVQHPVALKEGCLVLHLRTRGKGGMGG